MKSIKEKADEYARDYLFSPLPQRAPNIHFEAGANYVLSVLYDIVYKEDWITNPKDGIRRFFEIYRQLKK